MKIGLDILGGDFAPESTILGAIEAQKVLPTEQRIVLIGDEHAAKQRIQELGARIEDFDFVHAPDNIGMGEHPTKAIAKKPDSSIVRGFDLLKNGEIDSFASAGNTGAMLVGALFSVKAVPGILRPAIATNVPKLKGGSGLLLDVGANADCKPEMLNQFAILGSLYIEHVLGIKSPKVGLVNIGEEEEKGNILTTTTYPLLKNNSQLNFIGNIEGRDLFTDLADVMVCDGFTGNVILKMAESFYVVTKKKKINDEFFDRFNYEQYGGTPILGVNAPVIIGHGISPPEAIKNMVLQSRAMIESNFIDKIRSVFN
ncbi:phosphate acyltransferase PlsX [Sphingobacterium spiritivorum]|uniref:Phosphate acyltransferase n=1 Tax=Sphingobacterium spiritivorum ATCC 33861 TaxID=525373 RepID=D7VMR8_SPHSI|nr:phosphate acyltransferase PlsX [Sphingobacterium spiritivorum]EFK57215.1 fatty acid/phospholipid synthesis protein PlsX [Sphingobacterium spiritivorum ATCC 33861]QQT36695.1 phosphate acyltransferase PlsX [Sphingobacterium spiritivorum]WQD33447.1 phosphate acyltransferase PlsX [Sphingobacterium spiritivorum]SUJ23449.1 Phosphate acyltransferase [Sphingobacterium spiritivorum]